MPLKGKIAYFGRAVKTIWLRQLPYGLVSVAFLNPRPSPEVLLHRRFFCLGIANVPRPVIFVVNIGLWLRWVSFFAWRESFRHVRQYGNAIAIRDDISSVRQFFGCLRMALAHCIHPQAYSQYRLYRCSAQHTHWSYVYDNELVSYHRQNASSQVADKQRRLLSQKHEFAKKLRTHGVGVAESQFLPKGTVYGQLSLDPAISYFLKPNCGSRSIGAFRLDLNDSGSMVLRNFSDIAVSGDSAIELLERQFGSEDYLLQPRYVNHPGFSELDIGTDEVIVLRIITRRIGQTIAPFCAFLEIPVVINKVKRGYLFVQVNTDNGMVLPDSLDLSTFHRSKLVDEFKTKLTGFALPRWNECLANNLLAHRQFTALGAVAWDNVITSEKALILEGNSGWNVVLPQMFCGGLLNC